MAEETWRVILQEGEQTGGAGAAGGVAGAGSVAEQKAAKAQDEIVAEQKKQQPMWANVAKFVGGLVSIVGVIAFVFQMIRRSKIFSTFMDSFLMVLSSFIDILLIPLIPLFSWVLRLLVGLLPNVQNLSKSIENFFKDPWKAVNDIFAWLVGLPEKIFNGLSTLFGNMGFSGLSGLMGELGGIWGNWSDEVKPIFKTYTDNIKAIWANPDTSIWDKIVLSAHESWTAVTAIAGVTWEAIKESGSVIWEYVKTTAAGIWDRFYAETLQPLKDKMVGGVIPAGFVDGIQMATAANTQYAGTMADTTAKIKPIIDNFKTNLQSIWADETTSYWVKIEETGILAWVSIKDMAVVVFNEIGAKAVLVWADVCEKAKKIWDDMKPILIAAILGALGIYLLGQLLGGLGTAAVIAAGGAVGFGAALTALVATGGAVALFAAGVGLAYWGLKTLAGWIEQMSTPGPGADSGGGGSVMDPNSPLAHNNPYYNVTGRYSPDLYQSPEGETWNNPNPFMTPEEIFKRTNFGNFSTQKAIGDPFVTKDMFAFLHKGERVLSAAENRMGSGGKIINASISVSGAIESPFWGINTKNNLEKALQDAKMRI